MPIKILPPDTVSKIAAGEVIETPVSVLKELIENSIDAKANSITIEIEKNGKKLIRVKDNGEGMNEEDLSLALLRHSTSKIKSIDDIYSLTTYGFRGEALFSIFSVSKIKISSYNGKAENGTTIEAEGGDINSIKKFPSPPVKGTTIEVRDLFYNTPARFKFLRSDSYLRSSLIKLIEEFAIIRPNIRLKLIIDGKEIFDFLPESDGKILKRTKDVFGEQIIKNVIEIDETFGNIHIQGFVSRANSLISSRALQYCYINSRIVESKTIQTAVYKAYENIRGSKHPIFLISLQIDPSTIDVNVHPQKKEVKFGDENFIYQVVYKTVLNAIENKSSPVNLYERRIIEQSKEKIEFISEKEFEENSFTQNEFITQMYNAENKPRWYNPPVVYLGQAFSSVLIYQTKTSILLVDQHAAAERITFERYLNEFENQKITSSKLIVPVEVKIPKSNITKIIEMKEWLKLAGFEINQNGPSSIMVYSTPDAFSLQPQAISDIFIYLSEVILKPLSISSELKRDTLATIACKKSIKFKERLNEKTALHLIEELRKTKDSLHCPHGRPTMLEITKDELITKFGRTNISL
ncbi:MAG: DNA mismatch repair endonuclease MutL [Elusimicrobiota bacterium]